MERAGAIWKSASEESLDKLPLIEDSASLASMASVQKAECARSGGDEMLFGRRYVRLGHVLGQEQQMGKFLKPNFLNREPMTKLDSLASDQFLREGEGIHKKIKEIIWSPAVDAQRAAVMTPWSSGAYNEY